VPKMGGGDENADPHGRLKDREAFFSLKVYSGKIETCPAKGTGWIRALTAKLKMCADARRT